MKMKLVEMGTKDAVEFDDELLGLINSADWEDIQLMEQMRGRTMPLANYREIIKGFRNLSKGNKIIFPFKINYRDLMTMERMIELAHNYTTSKHTILRTNQGDIKFDFEEDLFIIKFSPSIMGLFPNNLEYEKNLFKGKGLGLLPKSQTLHDRTRSIFQRMVGYDNLTEVREYRLIVRNAYNTFVPMLHPENNEIISEYHRPENMPFVMTYDGAREFDIAAIFANYYKRFFNFLTTLTLESVI